MARQELTSIDDYELLLTETMTPWSPQQRVALAAAIAERWLAAYETFSAEEEWGDPASLRRSLEAVWSHVQGRALQASDVRRHLEQIEQITPHMDEFDAEEALISCMVVVDSLRSCGSPDNTIPYARSAALGVFEGLVEEWPIDPASQSRVWKKSVVRSELQAQLRLIEEIDALTAFDADAIKELRTCSARLKIKCPSKLKSKVPSELTNQAAFEQYRRFVESDIKGQVRGQPDPEEGSYLFAIAYLGYWMGRYSRRAQTINGGYGRLADMKGQQALVARNRARDSADDELPPWDEAVREVVELCLKNNSPSNVLDANSIQTPHAYGPSLRRLWLEGRRLAPSDLHAWKHVRDWAGHRPATWDGEDARKLNGWAHSPPELGERLARELSWNSTNDSIHPWTTEVDGTSWQVRVNDFPDELMYSLLIAGNDAGDFHDWPETWRR